MQDLPPHPQQPSPQPFRPSSHHQPPGMRPRWQPGEVVDGWVVAEITPYPRPVRPLWPINVFYLAESFTREHQDSLGRDVEMLYAPAAAQFVLAVVEYPSGPITRWEPLQWSKVEVVLRSPAEWTVPLAADSSLLDDAPPASADLRRLVDELAQQAISAGWEPDGRGRAWCSLRFRRRYADLAGSLRWK